MLPWFPLIAHLFKEEFEVKALSSAPHPPPMAKVCGWHLCHLAGKTQSTITTTHPFTGSIYTVTIEEPNQEEALPFLDTLVSSSPNNTLVNTVYRNHTHYTHLHWNSNHFITAKNSVFNTLAFRAKVVCTRQHTLQQEMEHIRKALLACNFPP